MARKSRIHYPGALYHVMLRGNARQTVFHQDVECRYFEEILARGLGQFGTTEPDARSVYLHFMGQTTGEELLDKLRHGSCTEGRILGNENFIQAALSRKNETVQAQIGIEPLVALVARIYQVPVREMTSASRARQLTQARAMATLIGVDHCGYLVSDLARYFNRDVPGLSRQVKALRARLEKNQSLLEKAAHIQDQITTITQA